MELYFATGNPNKVEEFREALQGTGVTVQHLHIDLDEIDAEDVEDVAQQKAKDAYQEEKPDGLVIVDDTGLYVNALNGFPGSHASFFLQKCGINGLLTLLDGEDNRKAYFKTSIAVYDPKEDSVTVLSGTCRGWIAHEPKGSGGFGYDSVFIPDDHDRTFAEDTAHKADISHRTRAIERIVDWIKDR